MVAKIGRSRVTGSGPAAIAVVSEANDRDQSGGAAALVAERPLTKGAYTRAQVALCRDGFGQHLHQRAVIEGNA
jgi:hypothetical protein